MVDYEMADVRPVKTSNTNTVNNNSVGDGGGGGGGGGGVHSEFAAFINLLGMDKRSSSSSSRRQNSPNNNNNNKPDDDDDDHHDILATENAALRQKIAELESSSNRSHQEKQTNNVLKNEIEYLRGELVQSRREKESEVRRLREENEIVELQRSALEEYLVELNDSAGSLRREEEEEEEEEGSYSYSNNNNNNNNNSSSSSSDHAAGGCAIPNPIIPTRDVKLVALEHANEALRSLVQSLRQSFAMAEDEKRTIQEEMEVKLACRETTIIQLESSLQQLQQATRMRFMKKGSKGGGGGGGSKKCLTAPASPDQAAGGQ